MSLKCADCGYLGDCKSFGEAFYKANRNDELLAKLKEVETK